MLARTVTRVILSGGLLVLLIACGGGTNGRYGEPDDNYEAAEDSDAREEVAEEARQAVYSERGADSDGTGADVSRIDAFSIEDAGNYVCTEDCAGHEAGFAWAQENDIEDAADCGGNSMSFIEGCEAFAQERQDEADREAQELAEHAAEEAYDTYENESYEEEEYDNGRMIGERY